MKSLIAPVVVAALLATPVFSFAQSNGPLTRAQVRAELVQFEKAGYNPTMANSYDFPANIQAAEMRVAAQRATTSGYGSAVNGSSQSGGSVVDAATPAH